MKNNIKINFENNFIFDEISDYYDSDMELVSTNISKYIQTNNGKEVNNVTTIAETSYKYLQTKVAL